MSEISSIETVHGRYVAASERFKCLWTFHQCLGGLCRIFAEPSSEPPSIDFQPVLDRLQTVGSTLNRTDAQELEQQLDTIQSELEAIQIRLSAEDSKVSPSTVRRFFQRVKKADAKSFRQMIGFYTGLDLDGSWSADRTDKVDFLLTRLGKVALGGNFKANSSSAQEFFNGLGRSAGVLAVPAKAYQKDLEALEPIGTELAEIESFAELNARGVIKRFRGIKHSLGRHLLVPDVAIRYLQINFQLETLVGSLFEKEENYIASKYQKASVLEIAAGTEDTLAEAISSFKSEFERFEKHLGEKNVRLDELANLKEVADRIEMHLDSEGPAGAMDLEHIEETLLEVETAELGVGVALPQGLSDVPGQEVMAEELAQLEELLAELDPAGSLEEVALSPALSAFRVERSELQAYFASATEEDRRLRSIVMGSCALRKRLVDLVKNLNRGEESGQSGDSLFEDTKKAVGAASLYMQRFEALIDEAVLNGELADAQALQVLRIRMMREYAGAWMQVYR